MMHTAMILMCVMSPVQSPVATKAEFALDFLCEGDPPLVEHWEGLDAPGPYPRWSLGAGVDVYTGFGPVFNDVAGASFRGGYRIDSRWGIAVSLFFTDFDFEDPAENVFDRSGTPVTDASIDMVMFSATARRYFTESGAGMDFYVGAGLGLAFPGSGEAVSRPQVDIEVEGNFGPEVHVVVGGAFRIFEQLYFTAELRLMQSFTKYDVEDRQTGETDSEPGWLGYGIGLGLEYRF
jgi:hypothetical protein